MKRLFLTLGLFVLHGVVSSQTVFGIYTTPALNYLRSKSSSIVEPRTQMGVSIGVHAQFRLLHSLAIRTGVGFGINNYTYRIEGLSFSSNLNEPAFVEANSSNQEIQIPLLLQFNTRSHLFFAAGPEFVRAFNPSSERTLHYSNGDVEKLSSYGLQNKFNYALTFSLGYGLPLGDWGLAIEPQVKAYQKTYMELELKQLHYGLKVSLNRSFSR